MTINTKAAKPADDKAKTEEGEKKPAGSGPLSDALKNLLAGQSRVSTVAAHANAGYKAVKVEEGKTVEMPFGAPFKPVVKSFQSMQVVGGKPKPTTQLSMSLVGIAGENCTNLLVNGQRPGKPEFTITDPDGKEVQKGSFEYG